jgi:type IV secretory pathway TraG/TraD family ATPase VirD4
LGALPPSEADVLVSSQNSYQRGSSLVGAFLANAGVIEFFRPNDLVTADYLSRRLGTMTQGTTSQSVSASETGGSARTSWSYGSTGRSLLQPDEVLQLDEAGAVLFVQGLPPIWASRAGYYETARYAGMFDPDPEHQAVASTAGPGG